jgi:hypothetical protein
MHLRSVKLYKVRRKGRSLWERKLKRGNYNFDNNGLRELTGGPASNRRYSIGEMYCGGIGTLANKILESSYLYKVFTICIQTNFSALHGAYIFYRRFTSPGCEETFCFLRII